MAEPAEISVEAVRSMTISRVMGLLALVAFAVSLGIVAFKIARLDLFIACGFGLALAGYDMWTQLGPRRRG